MFKEPKKKKTKKINKFELEKKKPFNFLNFFLVAAQFCFCPLHPYISKATNNFEKNFHTQVDLNMQNIFVSILSKIQGC